MPKSVVTFLSNLFQAADPDRSKGERVTARELLDVGRRQLATGLGDQPQTKASMLQTIGHVYRLLGVNDAAEDTLTQALALQQAPAARDPVALADTLSDLARVYSARGDIERADRTDTEVLGLRRASLRRGPHESRADAEQSRHQRQRARPP